MYTKIVSMHLMVLGASRRQQRRETINVCKSLNAPGGAGCFLTLTKVLRVHQRNRVSMHLVVLGASRRRVVDSQSAFI